MNCKTGIKIRIPRTDDIAGIVELVRTCEPFLSVHGPYLYWIYIQYWRETCAVAESDGQIIGWCSIIPVSGATYLFHQLGVAPHARRLGLGKSLFVFMLERLKARHRTFAIEFTVDRRNGAALDLDRAVAAEEGMRMTQKPDIIPALEGSEEVLYVMTPAEQMSDVNEESRSSVSDLDSPENRRLTNSEQWRAQQDGTYHWRDQADGFFK